MPERTPGQDRLFDVPPEFDDLLYRKAGYWLRATYEGSPTNGAEGDKAQLIPPDPEKYPSAGQGTTDFIEEPHSE